MSSAAPRMLRRIASLGPAGLFAGPILAKEAAVLGRRKLPHYLRLGYLLLVAVGVGLALFGGLANSGNSASALISIGDIASACAITIGVIQYAAVVLIAAVLTAALVSEERLSRTLPSLMTTPMTAGQIVCGKFAARTVELVILTLIPAPILLALRAFGGIEGTTVLAFAAAALTDGLLVAAVAAFMSVWQRTPVRCIVYALLVYGALTGGAAILFGIIIDLVATATGSPDAFYAIAPVFFAAAAAASGPALVAITNADDVGSSLGIAMPLWIGWAVFLTSRVLLVGLLLAGASWGLRRTALREATESAAVKRARRARRRAAPTARPQADAPPAQPVPTPTRQAGPRPNRSRSRRPRSRTVRGPVVLWREIRTAAGWRSRSVLKLFTLFAAAVIVALAYTSILLNGGHTEAGLIDCGIGIAALALLLLATVISYGSSIADERDARSWDTLLTTPLSAREIVWSKLAGGAPTPLLLLAFLLFNTAFAAGIARFHGPDSWWSPAFVLATVPIALAWWFAVAGVGVWLSNRLNRGLHATAASVVVWVLAWAVLPVAGAALDGILTSFRSSSVDFFLTAAWITNPLLMSVSTFDVMNGDRAASFFFGRVGGVSLVAYTLAWLGNIALALAIGCFATHRTARSIRRLTARRR